MVWDFFKRFVIFAPKGSVVRKIAWLTMIGLTLSLSAMVLVLGVMTALNRSQKDRTLAVEPHLTVEVSEAKSINRVENHPGIQKIKSVPNAHSYSFETQDVILRTMDGKFRGAVARGISWDSLREMLASIHPTGHKTDLPPTVEKPEAGEVIIGVNLAHGLGVFEGDALMVIPPEELLLPPSEAPKFERVKVRQILVSNVTEIDEQMIFYINGETLNSMKNTASRRLGTEVRLADPEEAEALKEDLLGFSDLTVETWRDRNAALFFALKLEKLMITTFLSMAALIAGLSLISVISLLISQKSKEIGLLQAIGLSRKRTFELFSRIGFLLALFGIGGGLVIGTAMSYYLEIHPLNILPDIYYDSQIPSEVQLSFIASIAVIGLGLAYLGSRFAVRSGMIADPSQALRGKN